MRTLAKSIDLFFGVILIIALFLLGCKVETFTNNKEETKAFKNMALLVNELSKLDSYKQNKTQKFEQFDDSFAISRDEDIKNFLSKQKDKWIKHIIQLENYVKKNKSSKLCDDILFVTSISLWELGLLDLDFSSRAIEHLESFVLQYKSLDLDERTKKIFNRYKLFRDFAKTLEVQEYDKGSNLVREFCLETIVAAYIQQGKMIEARQRVEKAKDENFKEDFLQELLEHIETSTEMMRKYKEHVTKERQ